MRITVGPEPYQLTIDGEDDLVLTSKVDYSLYIDKWSVGPGVEIKNLNVWPATNYLHALRRWFAILPELLRQVRRSRFGGVRISIAEARLND